MFLNRYLKVRALSLLTRKYLSSKSFWVENALVKNYSNITYVVKSNGDWTKLALI